MQFYNSFTFWIIFSTCFIKVLANSIIPNFRLSVTRLFPVMPDNRKPAVFTKINAKNYFRNGFRNNVIKSYFICKYNLHLGAYWISKQQKECFLNCYFISKKHKNKEWEKEKTLCRWMHGRLNTFTKKKKKKVWINGSTKTEGNNENKNA